MPADITGAETVFKVIQYSKILNCSELILDIFASQAKKIISFLQ